MLKAAGAHPLNVDLHKIKAFKDQTESAAVGPWKGYQVRSKIFQTEHILDLHKIKAFKDQTESAAVGPWKGYQVGRKIFQT